ncbi:hypothetical protein IWX49DRAFT_586745 [Phyllosticta citricarpa]|uniref:Uncharacterized protein n=1 Tax=Phyllosticta citricarpa TaxID=55181 RepID=A0ABR1MQR4_9PEZI
MVLLQTSSEVVAMGLNAAAFSVAAYLPLRYFGPKVMPRRAARIAESQAARSASTTAIPGASAAAVGGAATAGALAGQSHGWRGSVAALLRLGTRGRGGGSLRGS